MGGTKLKVELGVGIFGVPVGQVVTMKWKSQPKQPVPNPCEGAKRIKIKFLLFPRCINQEWRWLEKAAWEQEYAWVSELKDNNMVLWVMWDVGHFRWIDKRWVEIETRYA